MQENYIDERNKRFNYITGHKSLNSLFLARKLNWGSAIRIHNDNNDNNWFEIEWNATIYARYNNNDTQFAYMRFIRVVSILLKWAVFMPQMIINWHHAVTIGCMMRINDKSIYFGFCSARMSFFSRSVSFWLLMVQYSDAKKTGNEIYGYTTEQIISRGICENLRFFDN